MAGFWFRCAPVAMLAALGAALGGCSSATSSMPSFSSLFGSGSNSAAANSNAAAPYTPPTNFECPPVTVRQGAGTYAVSADKGEPTATNLRYQFSLGDSARECHLAGPMLTMKVGVRGRAVVGPAGGPGEFKLPIRIAVVREGVEPKTIATKLSLVPVSLPPGDGNVPFSHVEDDLTFPMPPRSEIDAYVIYVGFDPQGAQELERKKAPPRGARPRHRG